MWNNLDIRQWPLAHTIVVAILLWVFNFLLTLMISIFTNPLSVWLKEVLTLQKQGRCSLFQWIDGPEIFDPQILLFPYDRNESFPYCSFKHWIPPPPNVPPMIDEEEKAITCRVSHPPLWKCGYRLELANLPIGLDYTPLWRCPIPLSVIARKTCLSFVVMIVLIWYSWHYLVIGFVG
jgi:hypothetical protein